ncbi:MAG: hypothetical protein ACR2JY_19485 [Chloroflexota bacterium]
MARTVLDTVLDQLELTPPEYFQRLSISLDEARLERLHRASVSRDTDLLIQDEVGPPSLSLLPDLDVDELTLVEPGEEEPLTAAGAAAKARAKKPSRVRTPRPVGSEEEEDELAEFGLEPLTDDESQFRQAYRRALRTNRRPFRER